MHITTDERKLLDSTGERFVIYHLHLQQISSVVISSKQHLYLRQQLCIIINDLKWYLYQLVKEVLLLSHTRTKNHNSMKEVMLAHRPRLLWHAGEKAVCALCENYLPNIHTQRKMNKTEVECKSYFYKFTVRAVSIWTVSRLYFYLCASPQWIFKIK